MKAGEAGATTARLQVRFLQSANFHQHLPYTASWNLAFCAGYHTSLNVVKVKGAYPSPLSALTLTSASRGNRPLRRSRTMDDHGEFDSVSWQRDDAAHAESSAPIHSTLPDRSVSGRRSDSLSSEPQAGDQADQVDLAGIGRDGILEVTVDTPLKENDGTKDAYVSYLVTTHVRLSNTRQYT